MKENVAALAPADIDALIFDMDGVVTNTRSTHEQAWKELFDAFLKNNGKKEMQPDDYARYLDGKPRYEGVKSFLQARQIDLPYGKTDDPPGEDTVCGLGNRKDEIFNTLIEKEGAERYPDAVEKIEKWRKKGLKTAIVSSSKNCEKIIAYAGAAHLFDVRVDGVISEERNLTGKPHPDIFLEAARELGVRPENSIVFEDAISGVEAGQKGFFGLVAGVARFENRDVLLQHGADITFTTFEDFNLFEDESLAGYFRPSRPLVFSGEADLFDKLSSSKPVFFLDYDGTLTPIVNKPEDAVLSDSMRDTLAKLAELFTVAIVTGRDVEDVQQLVGLDNLIYSGSHGYITTGPDGMYMEHERSDEIIALLDMVEKDLHDLMDNRVEGVQIERKRYAIAVHYRNAEEKDVPFVYQVVERLLERHDGLKTGEGKKIVEIKPDIDWHKGKAVRWIMDKLGVSDKPGLLPLFIGDDVTDEDAFRALSDNGVGILVENHGQQTAAAYSLKNVFQVEQFFKKIIEMYR